MKTAQLELTVKDHTEILQIFLKKALLILAEVDLKKHVSRGTRPTDQEVFEAFANIKGLTRRQRLIILSSAKEVAQLGKTKKNIPPETIPIIDNLMPKIDRTKSPKQLLNLLIKEKIKFDDKTDPYFLKGINSAIDMLKDGLDTIYNPNSSYLTAGGIDLGEAGMADAKGFIYSGGSVTCGLGSSLVNVIGQAVSSACD